MKRIGLRLVVLELLVVNLFAFTQADKGKGRIAKSDAAVTIDGDASEWASIPGAPITLTHSRDMTSSSPVNKADLSAQVRSFSDGSYLYLSFKVLDDRVIVDEESFGHGWRDDSVEIRICPTGWYDQAESFEQEKARISCIRILGTRFGGTRLEGQIVVPNQATGVPARHELPYVWDLLGVKAKLGASSGGYTAEAAIPLELLSWLLPSGDSRIRVTAAVLDDDDGGGNDTVLAGTKPVWEGAVRHTGRTRAGTSFNSKAMTIAKALERFADQDCPSAVSVLSGNTDFLILPIRAAFHLGARDFDLSIKTLQQIAADSNEIPLIAWATEQMARTQRARGDYEAARRSYQDLARIPFSEASSNAAIGLAECAMLTDGLNEAARVYDSWLQANDFREPRIVLELGHIRNEQKDYSGALKLYSEVAVRTDPAIEDRSSALLFKQDLESKLGDLEAAIKTGLFIQSELPGDSRVRSRSLQMLVKDCRLKQGLRFSPKRMPDDWVSVLDPIFERPARTALEELERAGVLLLLNREEEAQSHFRSVLERTETAPWLQAWTLLQMQRLVSDQGDLDRSLALAERLHIELPGQTPMRVASIEVLRESYRALGRSIEADPRAVALVRRLEEDLKTAAHKREAATASHARALLEKVSSDSDSRR